MGDDNIFDIGDSSLLDRFIGILDRQTDTKLTPTQLMGFLSLFNVLGVLNLMHGSGEAGVKDVSALANLTSLAGKAANSPEGPAIKDTLLGLLGGQNQSGPDLGGLLNMLGGNKKINPQMLLTLLNLLNSQSGNTRSDQPVPKVGAAKSDDAAREQAGEVKGEKTG